MSVKENVERILRDIPNNVTLIAASKTRTPQEVTQAFESGIKDMGENYIQEGIEKIEQLSSKNIKWHFVGHLQKNKVKKAVRYFDVIQTVDSFELAQLINKESIKINKTMDIMIEINIGREKQKSGVFPEEVYDLANKIKELENLRLVGVMTMGPVVENPEKLRPFFKEAKSIYDDLKKNGIELKYLSMGMSDSYLVAIEEGSNMVRIGTKIFGPRKYNK